MAKAKVIKSSDLLKRNGALEVHGGDVYAIFIDTLSSEPTILVRGKKSEMHPADFKPGMTVIGQGHGGKFDGIGTKVLVRETPSTPYYNAYPLRLADNLETLEEYRTSPNVKPGVETKYGFAQYGGIESTWKKLGAKGWIDIDSIATRVPLGDVDESGSYHPTGRLSSAGWQVGGKNRHAKRKRQAPTSGPMSFAAFKRAMKARKLGA